jgi:protein TonB
VRYHIGPALERGRLPLTPALVSAAAHVVVLAAVAVGAILWGSTPSKPVIVNLVPSVAAVGSPQGRASLPPRVEEAKPRPPELPAREAPRDLPARDLPPRDLPPRDSPALPDRSLPTRTAAALPRPDSKELPSAPSPAPSKTPASTPVQREASAPPPQPLGTPSGSTAGTGPVALNVTDFPYAYYIRQVHQKIQERWNGRAIPGQQPAVVFEIGRDGRLNQVVIDKSSGNTYYDQVALRAINDAGPFPPLPVEYKKSVLRIGLQFVFDPTGG